MFDCENTTISGPYICDPNQLIGTYDGIHAAIDEFMQAVRGKCSLNFCACTPNSTMIFVKIVILPNLTNSTNQKQPSTFQQRFKQKAGINNWSLENITNLNNPPSFPAVIILINFHFEEDIFEPFLKLKL